MSENDAQKARPASVGRAGSGNGGEAVYASSTVMIFLAGISMTSLPSVRASSD